jgi:hypothetical protein
MLTDCDFAKPGRRLYREMYDARAILAVVRIVKPGLSAARAAYKGSGRRFGD